MPSLGVACAAACVPLGFGVAVATGVRPLGGVVLVALAAVADMRSDVPRARRVAWYSVVAACFVASHLLGHVIGAWGRWPS